MQGVAAEPLTLVLEYRDDSDFQWISELILRRDGTDVQGRQVWRVTEQSARMT
jgi:hypothetical protein